MRKRNRKWSRAEIHTLTHYFLPSGGSAIVYSMTTHPVTSHPKREERGERGKTEKRRMGCTDFKIPS